MAVSLKWEQSNRLKGLILLIEYLQKNKKIKNWLELVKDPVREEYFCRTSKQGINHIWHIETTQEGDGETF